MSRNLNTRWIGVWKFYRKVKFHAGRLDERTETELGTETLYSWTGETNIVVKDGWEKHSDSTYFY